MSVAPLYDRLYILACIEEATGEPLPANDPLPDSLIAEAQQLSLEPIDLRLWIYDEPARTEWSMSALARWAQRYELGIYRAGDGAPKAAA